LNPHLRAALELLKERYRERRGEPCRAPEDESSEYELLAEWHAERTPLAVLPTDVANAAERWLVSE
jgi:hypothetical protein